MAASHGPDDGLASELLQAAEGEIAASRLAAGVERLLWASRIAVSEELRERALLRAVECLVLVGDMPRANLHLDAVLACSDSPRRSYAIAFLTAANGRLLEAEAECREMMERPDYHDDPELDGPASATLALLCSLLGRGEDGVEHARTALDVPGLPPTARTVAMQALCLGLVMSGRGDEAIGRLGFLSPARIEPEPFEAELLTSRAQFKAWWGDLAGAAEDLSAVIRWARAGVPFRGIPNAYGGLAEVEYRLGHWNAGLTYADAAVSLGEDSERLWDLPYVRAVASYLNAVRGNWSTAKEHVDAARRGAELTPLPMCIYYACTAGAHLAWVQGEWEALLRAAAPMLAPLTGGGIVTGLGRRAMQAMVTEAMLSTGRIDEAEELLGMIEGTIDETLNDPTRIEAWRLRGLLESERDRPGAGAGRVRTRPRGRRDVPGAARSCAARARPRPVPATSRAAAGWRLRRCRWLAIASGSSGPARSWFDARPSSPRAECALVTRAPRTVTASPRGRTWSHGWSRRANRIER